MKGFNNREINKKNVSSEPEKDKSPGPDEVFCTECGEVIKERAEICPNCGVNQTEEPLAGQGTEATDTTVNVQQDEGANLTERRQYELEKIANKSKGTTILVALLITPLAYWMIGKKMLAAVNFFTLNYFLLGFFIVPIHCYIIIENAEEELRKAGVAGY